jgi:hypothetical protein
MLTYADIDHKREAVRALELVELIRVCWRMLADADVKAGRALELVELFRVCWRMLTYADGC